MLDPANVSSGRVRARPYRIAGSPRWAKFRSWRKADVRCWLLADIRNVRFAHLRASRDSDDHPELPTERGALEDQSWGQAASRSQG